MYILNIFRLISSLLTSESWNIFHTGVLCFSITPLITFCKMLSLLLFFPIVVTIWRCSLREFTFFFFGMLYPLETFSVWYEVHETYGGIYGGEWNEKLVKSFDEICMRDTSGFRLDKLQLIYPYERMVFSRRSLFSVRKGTGSLKKNAWASGSEKNFFIAWNFSRRKWSCKSMFRL